jgi:hypothetical protein
MDSDGAAVRCKWVAAAGRGVWGTVVPCAWPTTVAPSVE